jgi:hypothetical protein
MSSPLEILHRFGIVAILDGLGTKTIVDADIRKNMDMTDRLRLRIKKAVDDANKLVITKPAVMHEVRAFQDTFIIAISVDYDERIAISEACLLTRTADILTPLFLSSLAHQIWLRGAFSIGEFFSAKYQIKGAAVSDAGNYYDNHKWVGMAAAPLAEKAIVSSIGQGQDMCRYFETWDLSTDAGNDTRYVINWMNKFYYQDINAVLKNNGLTYEGLADGIQRTIETQLAQSSGDARTKWEKTRAFFERMKNK